MKAKRILNVLTLVDSRYIEELYIQEDTSTTRKPRSRRFWLIAAIAAVMLALVGCVAYMLSLRDLQLTVNPYSEEYATESTEKTDIISLQGFVGTPNYQAAKEWAEFRKNYDPDNKIMNSLSNEEMIMPEAYLSYGCYTKEMTAKVDEICEKYGLNKQGAPALIYSTQQLYEAVGIDGILRENARAKVNIDPVYFYKTGSFMLSCDTILLGENSPWSYNLQYEFYCAMKTDFDDVLLNVGDIENYDQWEYTTWNGLQTLLALSSEKAMVIVDNGTVFTTINIMNPRVGDEISGEQMMTREALEAFADIFDFTFVPQPINEAHWEKAKQLEQAELDAYNAERDAWIHSDANPANQKDVADYLQHLIDYERTQNLYYGLYDLNGDGEYELLVGSSESEFGQVVVFVDGAAQVTTLGFFEGMYLCEGNVLEITDVLLSWDNGYKGWFYQYDTAGNANLLDCVMLHEDRDPDNPWFRNPTGNSFASPWEPISEEEFNEVRGKYLRVEVKLKPITEVPFE